MQLATTVRAVLSEYPADCQPLETVSLGGAGGFSGAEFWRLESRRGSLCLRRWPSEHPSRERLAWIHAVVRHVALRGFRLLPEPILSRQGASFIECENRLWELTHWLPGRADFHEEPSRKKLDAVLTSLAQFHVAASSFLATESVSDPRQSRAVLERLDLVERLLGGGINKIRAALVQSSDGNRSLTERSLVTLSLVEPRLVKLRQSLKSSASIEVSSQPCLRDIWHDHVLFVGDKVSGIVDLGAMRVETVAADVARLAGSLCGTDREAWQTAIRAYEAVRPLNDAERRLIPVLDLSQTLLAGINWIEWVYIQRRHFEDPTAVEKRITDIQQRLTALLNTDVR